MKRLIIVLILLSASIAALAQTSELSEIPVLTVEATTVADIEPEPHATPEPEPSQPELTEPEPETTVEQKETTPEPTPLLETTAKPAEISELFSTFEATTPPPTQQPELLGYPTDASDPADEEGEEKELEEQYVENVTTKKNYQDEEVDTDDYSFTDDSVASSTNSISYILAVFMSNFLIFWF